MTKQEVALHQATQGAVEQFRDEEFAAQVALAVPEGVSHRQLLRAAMTAVLENPAFAAPALRPSLLQSTLKAAQDGLLPDGRDAAFVLYRTKDGPKIQYQPMIGGLRRIAAEHGWSLITEVVHANDRFEPDLERGQANHRRPPLGDDRGELVGAYAVAVHRDGTRLLLMMDRKEIEKVRQTSKAKDAGPWIDWFERMAEKTVGKRLFKKLPLNPADKRIGRVLRALEEEPAPADILYGEAARVIADRSATGISSPPEPPVAAGEDDGTPGVASPAEPDKAPPGLVEGEEPDDETLDAMAAALEGEVVDEAETGEWRFPSGKYEGETVLEVYESGGRGRAYVQWAATGWPNESLRDEIAEALAVLEGDDDA